MPRLRSSSPLPVLVLLSSLAAPLAAHQIQFDKNDAADDDVGRGGTLVRVREATAPARVHWVLRIRNRDATDDALDWVLDDLSERDAGASPPISPPAQRLDCSAPITATGSSTPVSWECPVAAVNDPATPFDDQNTIRFTGVTVPAGGTVTLEFWAEIHDGFEGKTCNAAHLRETHDGTVLDAVDGGVPGSGICILVGTGRVTDPIFTKDDGDDDDVWDNALGSHYGFPGGRFHWIIQLNNPLNFPDSAHLWDDLPPEQLLDCSTFVITSDCGWVHPDAASCCDENRDPEIDCRLEALPGGCLVTMEFWSVLDPAFGGTTCNTANVQTDTGFSASTQPAHCTTTIAPPDTVIKLHKGGADDNGGDLEPGDVITWTLDVHNDGTSTSSASVRDPLAPYLIYAPGSLVPFPGASCSENDTDGDGLVDEIACAPISVPAQDSVIATFQTVLGCAGLDVDRGACNQAFMPYLLDEIGSVPVGSSTNVPAPTCLPVVIPFRMTAMKDTNYTDADGDGVLSPGDPIVYAVTVTNTGSRTDDNVAIRDAVPAGASFLAGSIEVDGVPRTDATGDDAGEISGGAVFGFSPSLAPGQSAELRFQAAAGDLPDRTAVCNEATVTSDEADSCGLVTSSNLSCRLVEDIAVIELVKSGEDLDGPPVRPGDAVRYDVRACNTGGRRAEGLAFADTIPAATTYVPGSLYLGGFNLTDAAGDDNGESDGTTVTARASSLAPGACLTMSFEVMIAAGTPGGTVIANTADLSADPPTQASRSNSLDLEVGGQVQPVYTLQATKRAEDAAGNAVTEVPSGDPVFYSVTVCNDGASPDPAPGVVFSDPVPAGTSYAPGTITLDGAPKTDASGDDEAEFDGTAVRADLGDLAPGACAEVAFEVILDAATPVGAVVSNLASAAGEGGAGAPAEASVDVTVTEPAIGVLRGFALLSDPDPDCPAAGTQPPRLDPTGDLCPAVLCSEVVAGSRWRVLGDGLSGVAPLTFYEAVPVPCSRDLRVRRDPPSAPEDLFLELR